MTRVLRRTALGLTLSTPTRRTPPQLDASTELADLQIGGR